MFIMLERLFKPIVIFFRLTNFLVIFQIMINEILQDLINTGKAASFINNVIIRIEEKEEHNEVIKKVVKRLVENNFYVKLEKCK